MNENQTLLVQLLDQLRRNSIAPRISQADTLNLNQDREIIKRLIALTTGRLGNDAGKTDELPASGLGGDYVPPDA